MNFSTVPPWRSSTALIAAKVEDPAERLWIEALAERGRTGHVGEDDRDRLPQLGRGSRTRERRAALEAEVRAWRILASAPRADRHDDSVRQAPQQFARNSRLALSRARLDQSCTLDAGNPVVGWSARARRSGARPLKGSASAVSRKADGRTAVSSAIMETTS
jgi:hypothetical protein